MGHPAIAHSGGCCRGGGLRATHPGRTPHQCCPHGSAASQRPTCSCCCAGRLQDPLAVHACLSVSHLLCTLWLRRVRTAAEQRGQCCALHPGAPQYYALVHWHRSLNGVNRGWQPGIWHWREISLTLQISRASCSATTGSYKGWILRSTACPSSPTRQTCSRSTQWASLLLQHCQ